MVSEDPFLLIVRMVELLSMDALPWGISSSTIEAALCLPFIVLEGDGWPLLFIEDDTLRATVFFVGVALIEDTVDFTDAME